VNGKGYSIDRQNYLFEALSIAVGFSQRVLDLRINWALAPKMSSLFIFNISRILLSL